MRSSERMSGSSASFTLLPAGHFLVTASVIFIVASTPALFWHHMLAFAILALCLLMASKVSFLKLVSRLVLLSPFLTAVALSSLFLSVPGKSVDIWHTALPSFSPKHLQFAAWLFTKALLSTWLLLLFGMAHSPVKIGSAMRQLHVPAFFVELIEMTIRYMGVFERDFTRLRMTALARGLKLKHLLQIAPLGNLAGAQFLRSMEHGERIHLAMQARGYSSPVQVESKQEVGIQQLILPVCFIVIALVIRICPL